jgi:hypothetical protein
MKIFAHAAIVLALGCGAQNESGQSACERHVVSLEARLRSVPADRARLLVPPGIDLPLTDARGTDVDHDAIALEISSDGSLRLDDQPMRDVEEVRSYMASTRERWALIARRDPTRTFRAELRVYADRRARMNAVREAVHAASAERVVLLARTRAEISDPPACPAQLRATCDRLERSEAAERASLLADELARASGSCRPLADGFGALATMEPDARGAHFRRFLPDALRECRCGEGTDPSAMEYLAFVTLGGFEPELRAFELAGSPGEDENGTVGEWLAARR